MPSHLEILQSNLLNQLMFKTFIKNHFKSKCTCKYWFWENNVNTKIIMNAMNNGFVFLQWWPLMSEASGGTQWYVV